MKQVRFNFGRAMGIASLSALLSWACGGKQATAPPPEEPVDAPCCFDDRWEEPPPEIGQTPPERPAPADALEPYVPAD